ncbi:MAG: polyribonucleotide nucleotidyltransferase, polyribonucleotide nucleotidyltransferase [candidate division WS6 bacterium GW2011_GWC1_33_20]|uniref:Polyribonucleotide nucleotidyltransferase n=2 Tax=Candidatus Dojkabacteria TaxID=74243 RepID=A0A0G0CMI7_9BACT|nr:MAG: polyribonucleotide nucleotidyltransferase, polyribonucleotide nucleotidyltransferase [candidate division WS6 bacterium GW2011_GWE2_33_157]KKP44582.1 MAG: polyribonucleotide nucleotidyltransferase, polyribonucleotide nucleotidyltransferase [candidate division WS6 bacterium GW2011_GWC1_33_20]KKP56049.1 MAG: Polyribonucleotide nucleotidyltransferase [candidate division WS6 bacterium GW2011_GWF2_33_92]KKP82003.1 MAG: Polyribonucleotide nucleotidyltransferase [candidate division WS6 bacterium
MLFNHKIYEFEIDGRKCSFETGKLALRSESAILARMGDTVVEVNVNTAKAKQENDFFPLAVEYVERFYASGKISGSRFVKVERFPSDDAVLKARMIDRALRSRFPDDYRDDLSLIVTVMSYDEENDPVILAINAASVALMNSKAPFDGPVAGVRIGMEGESIKPIYRSLEDVDERNKMNYVLGGDGKVFTMIDAGCYEIPEGDVLKAMEVGLSEMNKWVDIQNSFMKLLEKKEKIYTSFKLDQTMLDELSTFLGDKSIENLLVGEKQKHEETKEEMFKKFEGKYSKVQMSEAYEKLLKKAMRKYVIESKKRVDGRGLDEVREMAVEVDLLPRVHGSALFTRGVTQVLSIATLGTLKDAKLIDDMLGEKEKRYMHYYNDLPFAYGEAERLRLSPSRRAIGHGMLAEKALIPVIPSVDEFPYTILVMSEVQGENGSSSMASACGSTLALMAAGVPIRKMVGGIACGLVTDDKGGFNILTDMQGVEDFYGDMDFKVTGTKDGITAVQMDNKMSGLTIEIVKETFAKSKVARLKVIEKMEEALKESRGQLSKFAPKVARAEIPVEKIGELIGPGGKNIRELTERTGAEIAVEENGMVNIYAMDQESIDKALSYVKMLGMVPVVGEIYDGKVASIMEYGAFVDIAPGISGLVHVSEITDEFVKDVRKYLKEGDTIKVKLIAKDRDGKLKLSIKQVNTKTEPKAETE